MNNTMDEMNKTPNTAEEQIPDILKLDDIMENTEKDIPETKRKYTKLDAASREVMKSDIVSMIRAGLTHHELMDRIRIRWGLEYAQAQKYVAVVRDQLHEDYLKYAESVAETNVNTLTEIRNQAMMGKNYRIALNAIDLLNKMSNLYENKVDLNVSTDAPIEIEFK